MSKLFFVENGVLSSILTRLNFDFAQFSKIRVIRKRFDKIADKRYNLALMRKINQSSRLEKIKRICLLALMLALTTIFCFVPVQFGTITLALMILPTLIVACCCDFKSSAIMGLAMGLINYIAWFTTKAASPIAPIFQNPLVCILPRFLIAVTTYLTRAGLEKAIFKTAFARRHSYEYQRLIDDANGKNDDIDERLQNDNSPSNDVSQSDIAHAEHSIIVSKSQKKYQATDTVIHHIIYTVSTAIGVVTNTLFVAIFTLVFFNNTSIAQNTVVTVDYLLAWFRFNFAIEVVAFSLLIPPIVLALRASKLVK